MYEPYMIKKACVIYEEVAAAAVYLSSSSSSFPGWNSGASVWVRVLHMSPLSHITGSHNSPWGMRGAVSGLFHHYTFA